MPDHDPKITMEDSMRLKVSLIFSITFSFAFSASSLAQTFSPYTASQI
jgi:hypothetical protein